MTAIRKFIAAAKALFAREFAKGVLTDAQREQRFNKRGGW